ncbi:extracellular solute-binding protein [Phototrophicus methaneseepsis]|uniref:Extracellular solute-binding protein n=1 Tax=Phototrophicus methaneseepsis TaxID=2710758 RepID=A0A7S8E9L9_9CHLR|nr:extracellular solute-binding protein [Phototrophicus methaneseepsis]QPC82877.1 extracellular solute-binding protein [Phototrophicus methaneseepsis]
MKKFAAFTLLVLALVLALPVVAQDDVEMIYEDVDPTGATVEFWHQHSGEREEALNAIVEEFNATNEWGITVVPSNQGGYGDIFQKMNLGLVEGGDSLPELVVAYQNQAATYQLVDGLIDMRPLVESPTWGLTEEDKADFFPGFYTQDIFPTFGNERLGFPPNRSLEVMYYNISWLNELYEAGAISFEGAPVTPDQFKEAACAAVENPYSAATGDPSTSIGYQLSYDASRFASWTFAFGGDIYDYEANQYTVNSPAAVEAMTFLQGLYADGCARDIEEAYGDQTNFGQGVTLFTVGSSSGAPFYGTAVDEGAGHEWSVGAIPYTTEEPVMNLYGASVSIPVSTPEQEVAAWLFVKYYTSTDAQATWAQASEYFPVRASVADGLADYFEANPSYEAGFDLLQYSKSEPPVPGYDFVRDAMETAMAEIMGDSSMDVQARLDELNEEANEILAEQ